MYQCIIVSLPILELWILLLHSTIKNCGSFTLPDTEIESDTDTAKGHLHQAIEQAKEIKENFRFGIAFCRCEWTLKHVQNQYKFASSLSLWAVWTPPQNSTWATFIGLCIVGQCEHTINVSSNSDQSFALWKYCLRKNVATPQCVYFPGESTQQLARFCGGLSVTRPLASVQTNTLRLVFNTDFSVTDQGFVINYKIGLCIRPFPVQPVVVKLRWLVRRDGP